MAADGIIELVLGSRIAGSTVRDILESLVRAVG